MCVCPVFGGWGGPGGPPPTAVGKRRDAAGIREVIEDASMVYGESSMPSFKEKLTGAQIEALADYLASRK